METAFLLQQLVIARARWHSKELRVIARLVRASVCDSRRVYVDLSACFS